MITNNLQDNINKIKQAYNNSIDVAVKDITIKDLKLSLVFLESITKSSFINEFILKSFSNLINSDNKLSYSDIFSYFTSFIPGVKIKETKTFEELYNYLSNGFTIVLFDKESKALAIETKEALTRSISEPKTEQTISGPKDSFNENYFNNIGLIRKRIKSTDLTVEEVILGRQSLSKVGIVYMNNIIEKPLLDEIRKKIKNISTDSILDSSYIREEIDTKNSIFPLIETTERPDLCSMSLLEGKVCIITENSPNVLIIPTFFTDLFHSPEDYYQKPRNVTFTRLIRLLAFFIAILLPAFYLAITTYNHETIPLTLIVNFAAQRDGVPFPAVLEAIGMTLIFEILRESDIRMPSFAGSSISILGAIVLGDAAVTAGIVSPIMVIVVAISSICNLMFSHISMINAIRLWRIIFMLFATCFGLPGVFFGIIVFVTTLCSLKSFGKPYLFPIAPLNFSSLGDTFVKTTIKKKLKRNPLLTDKNFKRSKS